MKIQRSELAEILARFFQAEDLPTVEIDRLHQAWQARAKDQLYLDMLERQFDPANRVAGGTAWWEERQQGRHGTVIPIAPTDLVKIWLTVDSHAAAPRARPWCPDSLVGSWRLVGTSKNGRDPVPPAAPREWVLNPDGRLDAIGDPVHQGWTWRAHRHSNLDLWLYRPGDVLPRIWYIRRLEGDQMDMHPPGAEAFGRWQRRS